MTISGADLCALNARDFARDGCAFFRLTERQLARRHGLRRLWSGGDTGRLIGYEPIRTHTETAAPQALFDDVPGNDEREAGA